jgi:hypothetical protein
VRGPQVPEGVGLPSELPAGGWNSVSERETES